MNAAAMATEGFDWDEDEDEATPPDAMREAVERERAALALPLRSRSRLRELKPRRWRNTMTERPSRPSLSASGTGKTWAMWRRFAQHRATWACCIRRDQAGRDLIAGERRLRACESLGWKRVPVRVVNIGNCDARRTRRERRTARSSR